MNALRQAVALVALIACAQIAQTAQAQSPATWTGFYVGINGGYGWGDRNSTFTGNDPGGASLLTNPAFATPLATADSTSGGGTFGFQAGYNWQLAARWVAGFEADFNFANMRDRETSTNVLGSVAIGGFTSGEAISNERLKWFGTARARLGYLVTDDLLLFGTGGFAYGKVEQDAAFNITGDLGVLGLLTPNEFVCLGHSVCFGGNRSSVETGWTLGGGAEWRFWKNVSLKVDYTYVNLGSGAFNISALRPFGTAGSSMKVTQDLEYQFVRAGLNWRF